MTGSYEVDESGFFGEGWSSSGRWDLLQFTVRSMVSFLSPPQANLSNIEGWIQMALRFVGPLLIAQAVIAVRDRVAR